MTEPVEYGTSVIRLKSNIFAPQNFWAGYATVASTPSTACQSPSACVIARQSAYAYFLETVVGRSEM